MSSWFVGKRTSGPRESARGEKLWVQREKSAPADDSRVLASDRHGAKGDKCNAYGGGSF